MCLATPLKVTRIEKQDAYVMHHGKEHKVSLQLLEGIKEGDWIMAHGEMALSQLPEDEAKVILSLIRQSHCDCK